MYDDWEDRWRVIPAVGSHCDLLEGTSVGKRESDQRDASREIGSSTERTQNKSQQALRKADLEKVPNTSPTELLV
jgi:hypothetical protein